MTMETSMPHHFDQAAAKWEEKPARLELARAVADRIITEIKPAPDMTALEFGCGTGLVTFGLAPHVKEILAVDTSRNMLEVLGKKIQESGIATIHPRYLDLTAEDLPRDRFDLIFSSMAIHHVPDVPALLVIFHHLLKPGGRVALADLDTEDGGFHKDVPGVYHLGFDRKEFGGWLMNAGFTDVSAVTAHVIRRENAVTGKPHEFPVFLMTGKTRRD